MPHKIIQTLPVIDGVSHISIDTALKKIIFETFNISMTYRLNNNNEWIKVSHNARSNTHIDEFISLENETKKWLEIYSQRA